MLITRKSLHVGDYDREISESQIPVETCRGCGQSTFRTMFPGPPPAYGDCCADSAARARLRKQRQRERQKGAAQPVTTFSDLVYAAWLQLAATDVEPDQAPGHPVSFKRLAVELGLTRDYFLEQLAGVSHPGLELIPQRGQNWAVGGQRVAALTFHDTQGAA